MALRARPLPAWASCRPCSKTFVSFDEAEGEPCLIDDVQGAPKVGRSAGGEAGGEAPQDAAAPAGGGTSGGQSQAGRCREFFLALAINHAVKLETVEGQLELASSSPDELAFVAGAEYFGFEYLNRERVGFEDVVTVRDKFTGVTHSVTVLEVFPYESSRKRGAVVVRLPSARWTP